MGAIRDGKHIGRNAPFVDTTVVNESKSRHEPVVKHNPQREFEDTATPQEAFRKHAKK